MTTAPASRAPRWRRSAVMIVTIVGVIVAVPFMLMLLVVRLGGER
ncbi:hypothetical protein [Sphingomonas phyllosphaerae]|nr:hypothetical protein [Sphingomonas phyllosphaerae]